VSSIIFIAQPPEWQRYKQWQMAFFHLSACVIYHIPQSWNWSRFCNTIPLLKPH